MIISPFLNIGDSHFGCHCHLLLDIRRDEVRKYYEQKVIVSSLKFRIVFWVAGLVIAYAIERLGRGQSGDAPDYSIERGFEDVVSLANSIDKPADVIGHSFGAACVLGAAQQIPSLRRVILHEPPMLHEQQSPHRAVLLDLMEKMLVDGERKGLLSPCCVTC